MTSVAENLVDEAIKAAGHLILLEGYLQSHPGDEDLAVEILDTRLLIRGLLRDMDTLIETYTDHASSDVLDLMSAREMLLMRLGEA